MSALRVAWVIYGSLDQVSGGYIYDRLVVEHLRALGDVVTVISLEPHGTSLPALNGDDYDVVLGDELCFSELAPLFRAAPPGLKRVLLIHHLTAWEHAPGPRRDELLALEKAQSMRPTFASRPVTSRRIACSATASRAAAGRRARSGSLRTPADCRTRVEQRDACDCSSWETSCRASVCSSW